MEINNRRSQLEHNKHNANNICNVLRLLEQWNAQMIRVNYQVNHTRVGTVHLSSTWSQFCNPASSIETTQASSWLQISSVLDELRRILQLYPVEQRHIHHTDEMACDILQFITMRWSVIYYISIFFTLKGYEKHWTKLCNKRNKSVIKAYTYRIWNMKVIIDKAL